MTKSEAESLADTWIKSVLENQENVFQKSFLEYPEHAESAAKSLAAFRKELVKELQAQ